MEDKGWPQDLSLHEEMSLSPLLTRPDSLMLACASYPVCFPHIWKLVEPHTISCPPPSPWSLAQGVSRPQYIEQNQCHSRWKNQASQQRRLQCYKARGIEMQVKWVFSGRHQWSIIETSWGVSPLFFLVSYLFVWFCLEGSFLLWTVRTARLESGGGETRNWMLWPTSGL